MIIRVLEKTEDVWKSLKNQDYIFVYNISRPNEVRNVGKMTIDDVCFMLDEDKFEDNCFFTFEYEE